MNKSALLDIIHQVSTISDQEVEELEKLVTNFPYCQTAHLLIAKASYDKGNMLSNQKLRKAAAYATNRHLLKKLIYTADAPIVLSEIKPVDVVELPEQPLETVALEVPAISEKTTEQDHVQIALPEEPEFKSDTEMVAEENVSEAPNEVAAIQIYSDPLLAEEDINATGPETVIDVDYASQTEAIPDEEHETQAALTEGENVEFVPAEPAITFTLSELDELLQVENLTRTSLLAGDNELDTDALIATLPIPEVSDETGESEDLIEVDNLPAEKEFAPTEISNIPIIRYELGATEETEEIPIDQTLANFDAFLFKPEIDEHPFGDLKPATTEEFIYEVYTRNTLGYSMGSSRLGEAVQVKDELTANIPLQFYPDLILEYSKQNYLTPTDPPKVTTVSRQLEIIDQFLKANPKLKSFASDKMRSEPHDDLAFKSTKNTKHLASENLATIMVKQGKIKKAIKIYEHLILKIPEKKAYFTSQIEKLKNIV